MNSITIKINDVEFRYASKPILKNICLELAPSEVTAVCGPNGVGKSTLIKCINKVLKPKGSIRLGVKEIKDMRMMHIARHIGYVPQRVSNVFSITVFEMVLMGRRPHLGWKSSQTDNAKVIKILRRMQIEELAFTDFNQLSGGQQQKVIIARALAQEPDVLLLDEPTSSLDLRHQLEVMELVRTLADKKGLTVAMAVHDLNMAACYADKVVLMKNGQIYDAGDTSSVLTPDNILSVYGVVAAVKKENGKPFIVPISIGRDETWNNSDSDNDNHELYE